MLELTVNPRSPAAINAALKKIKEMITTGAVSRTTPIHITLEPGTYRETVKLNITNPITIESVHGTKPENCIIQADNCESFNKGLLNRSIFIVGPNATNVTLKNFTIINEHSKNGSQEISPDDQAEAFVWNNTSGILFCEGMRIIGRQNTLCLKGYTSFIHSYIAGDVNFIYGDVDTAYFESSEIHVRNDNRGDFSSYVVNSQALAARPGFVFCDCDFTSEKNKENSIYAVRTDGKGNTTSLKNWDNVAFINCKMSDEFNSELVWDDDMSLEIFPRGNAKTGVREYKTKIIDKSGMLEDADTTLRNRKVYTLTDTDFFHGYASRYLILHETPFGREN